MSSNQHVGMPCEAVDQQAPAFTAYPNRETHLGDLPISRALPTREQRMIGPWCFLDRFGPLTFKNEKPMAVPPHPHIGLQTVSWLMEGEILHTDSLGSKAVLTPGGINVMTAGKGIAHAEETPPQNSGRLNGVQLWVALPEKERNRTPSFTNIAQVPILKKQGGLIQILAGELEGIASPSLYFSEILGVAIHIHPHETLSLDLNPQFEHAALLLEGDCSLDEGTLGANKLYILGSCRESLLIRSHKGCWLLLIGGLPFSEKILMWWNFVSRTPEEIHQARTDWEDQHRFGEVKGTNLPRLSAPDIDRLAPPNPAS